MRARGVGPLSKFLLLGLAIGTQRAAASFESAILGVALGAMPAIWRRSLSVTKRGG